MSELSRFYGLVIWMYYDDHPPPHFHVQYGEYRAKITIDSLAVLQGYLPPRALGLVVEMGIAPPRRVTGPRDRRATGPRPDRALKCRRFRIFSSLGRTKTGL